MPNACGVEIPQFLTHKKLITLQWSVKLAFGEKYLPAHFYLQSPSYYLEKWKFQRMDIIAHMHVHLQNRKGLND